jgi:importin-4
MSIAVLYSWVEPNIFMSQILPLVPDVVHVFAQVVVSPDESNEVKTNIGKAVSHLVSVYGQQMQPILSALPPAHANALAAFANKR